MKPLAFQGLSSLALCAALLFPSLTQSADCNVQTPSARDVSSTMAEAQALKNTLNLRGDHVVVLVRQGQNMDSYHLRYSHAAWAVRQPDGHWQVYHNLNECGTAHASLYVQGLYEFLADGLKRKEVAILRPSVALQARLVELLAAPQRLNLLHSDQYNLIAYPFSGPYQNSNGWLLEVFALANQPNVWLRNDARRWLKAQYYRPSELEIGFLEKTAVALFTNNISTDDQPASLMDSGKIQLNTGDSVIRFIARYSQSMSGCEHGDWGEAVCIFSP